MYQPKLTIRPQGARGIYQNWTICGELCTGNDILVQNIKIDDLRVGSTIIFENTGAYAVTEGMALFLSHVLPAVVLYDPVGGFTQVRARRETYVLELIKYRIRGEIKMEELLTILNDVDDSIDWEHEEGIDR